MSFKLPRLGSSQCCGTCSERGHRGTVLQIVSESYGIFVWELVSGEKLLFIYFSFQQHRLTITILKTTGVHSLLPLHAPLFTAHAFHSHLRCHKEAEIILQMRKVQQNITLCRKVFLKEAVSRMINTVSVGLFIFLRLLHQSPRWKIKIWKWPLHSGFKACVYMVHNVAQQVVATNGFQWFT